MEVEKIIDLKDIYKQKMIETLYIWDLWLRMRDMKTKTIPRFLDNSTRQMLESFIRIKDIGEELDLLVKRE